MSRADLHLVPVVLAFVASLASVAFMTDWKTGWAAAMLCVGIICLALGRAMRQNTSSVAWWLVAVVLLCCSALWALVIRS